MSSTPTPESPHRDSPSPVPSLFELRPSEKEPRRFDDTSPKEEPVCELFPEGGCRLSENDKASPGIDDTPSRPSPSIGSLSPVSDEQWDMIDEVETKIPLGLGADGRKTFTFPTVDESYSEKEKEDRKVSLGLSPDGRTVFPGAREAFWDQVYAHQRQNFEELMRTPTDAIQNSVPDSASAISTDEGMSRLEELGIGLPLDDTLRPNREETDTAAVANGVKDPFEDVHMAAAANTRKELLARLEALKRDSRDIAQSLTPPKDEGMSRLEVLGSGQPLQHTVRANREETDTAAVANAVKDPFEGVDMTAAAITLKESLARLEALKRDSRNDAQSLTSSRTLGHRRRGSERFPSLNRAFYERRRHIADSADAFTWSRSCVDESGVGLPADILDYMYSPDSDNSDHGVSLLGTPTSSSPETKQLSPSPSSLENDHPPSPQSLHELDISLEQLHTTTERPTPNDDMPTILKNSSHAQAVNAGDQKMTPPHPIPKKSVRFSSSPPEEIERREPVTPFRGLDNVTMMELATPAVFRFYNFAHWSPRVANMLGTPTRMPMAEGNITDQLAGNHGGSASGDVPRTPPRGASLFNFMNEIPGSLKKAAHEHFYTPGKSPDSRRVEEEMDIGRAEAEPTDPGMQHLLEIRGQVKVGGGTGIKVRV
jgi:hypothetical protein